MFQQKSEGLMKAASTKNTIHEQWILLARRRPTPDDADSAGDVVFLRSGAWECLGRISRGVPIDATAWKHTERWASKEQVGAL